MKIESPIYLAGSYSRRREIQGYAKEMEALGYRIGAEWVMAGHELPEFASPLTILRSQQQWAIADYHDIFNARTVINFTEPASGPKNRKRGGRHVELGMALALSGSNGLPPKAIILIGPCENIFHSLPIIQHFDTWEKFLAKVAAIDLPK